jgi:hypothetical protein
MRRLFSASDGLIERLPNLDNDGCIHPIAATDFARQSRLLAIANNCSGASFQHALRCSSAIFLKICANSTGFILHIDPQRLRDLLKITPSGPRDGNRSACAAQNASARYGLRQPKDHS